MLKAANINNGSSNNKYNSSNTDTNKHYEQILLKKENNIFKKEFNAKEELYVKEGSNSQEENN